MRGPRPATDRGSAALLLLGVVAAVAVVALGAAVAAGAVVLADERAQGAADAAALAAVHALDGGTSPTAAAAGAAAPYGGRVLVCRCHARPVAVTVEVPVGAPAARAVGITGRRATARASLSP